jgi:hypothetical protein
VKFSFNPTRATQAVAHLVARAGGRMNYTKMLKVLYLAERTALLDTGAPITGDRFVNMANGPVLSEVYDCIKADGPPECWRAALKREGYDLVLVGDPGTDELSEFELSLLSRLADEHKHRNFSAMIRLVHTLPEWRDPVGGGRAPLSYLDILRAEKVPATKIAEYEALNEEMLPLTEIAVNP